MSKPSTSSSTSLLVFILTLGVFGILNTEMGVVGILPLIAETFQVSISDAGWTVSVFALVVAFSGPILPLLFSGMNRKAVMLLSLGIFIINNLHGDHQFCGSAGSQGDSGIFPSGLCVHGLYRGRVVSQQKRCPESGGQSVYRRFGRYGAWRAGLQFYRQRNLFFYGYVVFYGDKRRCFPGHSLFCSLHAGQGTPFLWISAQSTEKSHYLAFPDRRYLHQWRGIRAFQLPF